VATALAELRETGVSAAVADFGGGAAPLASLVALPVERVKLASALVDGIDRSERSRALLSSAVHLVRSLGADAVATGVERQEQLEVLRAVGCGTVQGFLGVEPMDGAAFAVWAVSQDCARSLARAS
jgi:EAL domain-containing protein (putative c-di-GMP-specific phosphodiesterase class I)